MTYTVDKQEKYSVFSLEEETLNSLMAPQLKSEFVILSNEGVKNLEKFKLWKRYISTYYTYSFYAL